jgi:sialate O-acetylesterase
VLVGEVWVGSGQSNMAGKVAGYAKNDEGLAKLLAAAPYAKIRLATAKTDWKEATPENVAGFSALLFSFGADLQKDLDVPVGLMLGAVGGTPSGYWLSERAYAADEASRQVVAKAAESYSPEQAQARYEQALANWKKAEATAKAKGEKPRGRAPQPPVKPGQSNGKIGNLYEAHIRPFQPFAIRGVLWDQGEAGTAINGVDQFTLMGALIRGWRNEWGQGEFPFIYVQKPSGGGAAFQTNDPLTVKADAFQPLPAQVPDNGQYRALHIKIKEHPATAMVIASDLGSGIHPTNKSAYGARAERVALGMVYGRDVEIYGPTLASAKREGNKVRLTFEHVGQGLAKGQGEKLQGFSLAGDDLVFRWAEAQIEGDSVVLTCDQVAKPIAVRYAWSQTHAWANLFNKDGLPALPFDAWITK